MKYINLGNTQELIPVLGQGTMGLGGYSACDRSNDQRDIRALRTGIDMGMSLIDTAECYGAGHAEEIVGKAISDIRKKVFVATKVSPENLTFEGVRRSLESSLGRMRTDYIDLYQIHWPNPEILIDETISALLSAVKEGKIRYLGVSNFLQPEIQDIITAFGNGIFVSNQAEYSIFDRSIEGGLMQYCSQHDLTLLAYSPLDQGRITFAGECYDLMHKLSLKYQKTIPQVILNWLVIHKNVVALPKASSEKHIVENTESLDFLLTEEEYQMIDEKNVSKVVNIPVSKIEVVLDKVSPRKGCCTLEDAVSNKLGFCPSPLSMARAIKLTGEIKPVRIVRAGNEPDDCIYILEEGIMRYWAWVLAFEGERDIPALIR